jgi:hypothetical protein
MKFGINFGFWGSSSTAASSSSSDVDSSSDTAAPHNLPRSDGAKADADEDVSPDELAEVVRTLLRLSETRVREGRGEEALAGVLHAVRLTRGEDAIMDVLDEAKRRAEQRLGAEVDRQTAVAREMCSELLRQESLLHELGDEDLLRQAFEDGSSVVCRRCGGLVSAARWEAHKATWCPALDNMEVMDIDEDED